MNGNNSQLVRRCFEKRSSYWKESPSFSTVFQFKWQPFSKGLHFELLSESQKQMVNHFENHAEITTKDKLFLNLFAHGEAKRINVFDYVPLTFVLEVDSESFYVDFERFTHCYKIIETAIKNQNKEEANYEKECVKEINQKLSHFGIVNEKRGKTQCKAKLYDTYFAGHNIWILKPTGFNRGRGVTVFDTVEKLKTLIKYYSEGVLENGANEPIPAKVCSEKIEIEQSKTTMSNINNLPSIIKSRSFVIQKYVEKPLLIHNRKFDIRVWVLVTQEMKVYFFKEGYIRTSCETYSMDSDAINKRNIHLTNNAVQKYCEKYGAFEDGNQLSFSQFQVTI